ncbi:transcriptional regulator GlcC [Cobetia sp. cqz5-12]|uniref:transcriptional regulator GlcC n=1 Tax=Cobetia sp. cqz5-12 TaxID=2609415 RepID=UPI001902EBEF|nr:transcriptional regulator GlcC [Cobetia sp. cqz5-12]
MQVSERMACGEQRAPEHAAARLEQLILDGVLKPGQMIPSERRLCERLGISRASLREGLRLLRGKGIIETRHGKGSSVAALLPSGDISPLMHLFRDQPRTLYDLLEVRALLEGQSARLAAQRGTPADRVLIRRHYEAMAACVREYPPDFPSSAQGDEALPDAQQLARHDHAFHHAICEASHNPVLVHTLKGINDLLLSSVFASLRNLYHRPIPRGQINAQHTAIYRAVMDQQPDAAESAALDHLHGIRDSLRELEAEDERLIRSAMRLEGFE